MNPLTILHIEDEVLVQERYQRLLSESHPGTKVIHISSQEEFYSKISEIRTCDLAIVDLFLQDHDANVGFQLVGECRKKFPDSKIIISSSTNSLKDIQSGFKWGADDFLGKDCSPESIKMVFLKYLTQKNKNDLSSCPRELGAGKTLQKLWHRVTSIQNSAVRCVYVEGESGTGKEVISDLFEKTLTQSSPFVRVNCGSLSTSLLTSELFGHVRGSFSGATKDRKGLLESANGGWLFLDEISLLPLEAQAALLRVIENQSVRLIGQNKETPISVRFIAATNEPLSQCVEEGRFRNDLWQRLTEAVIKMPPLRERSDEIPDLVNFFLKNMVGGPYELTPRVLEMLCSYDWKRGNIRELRNVLRNMTENASGKVLTPATVPEFLWQSLKNNAVKNISVSWDPLETDRYERASLRFILELIKREGETNGCLTVRAMAQTLGIPKSTLYSKIEKILAQELITKNELASWVYLDYRNKSRNYD